MATTSQKTARDCLLQSYRALVNISGVAMGVQGGVLHPMTPARGIRHHQVRTDIWP